MSWITGLPERIADKIVPEPNSGCWLWTGCGTPSGYGSAYWSGRLNRAHRLIYEILRGPIPEGLQIDHLCRVRCCVNPDHLEPVTHLENVRRGSRATKTHCIRGHLLSGKNLRNCKNGWRRCRTCRQFLRPKHHINNRDKTHCLDGHPYTGENLYARPDGGRSCKACKRRYQRGYRLRKQQRLQEQAV